MHTETSFSLTRAALRGRSLGVLACSGFGALWASSALSAWAPAACRAGYGLIALITGALLVAAADMWRRSRAIVAVNGMTPAEQKRVQRRFLVIFAAEILLIQVCVQGLSGHEASAYLMPAIAIVVGLHFYPLAPLFRVPHYRITATLMTLAGLAAVLALAMHTEANPVNAVLAGVCAITLWMTCLVSWHVTRGATHCASARSVHS